MRLTAPGAAFWLVAFVVAAINLRAPIVVVGPLLDAIMRELSLSADSASLLATGMVICFGVVSPFAPALIARIGLNATVALLLTAVAAGGALRGVDHFGTMLLGTLLAGAGIAIGNVLMPALVKRDRPAQLGAMMGLYTLVMGVGATVAAGTAIPLMTAAGSWSAPIWAWAALAGAACLIWWLYTWRDRNSLTAQPERAAFTAMMGSRAAWQLTLFMGIQSLGFYTLQAWLPAVTVDAGVSHAHAGLLLSVLNLVSIPSGYLAARLATRLQRQSALAVVMTAMIIVGVAGLLVAPAAGALLWAILLGAGQGACFSLALTLIVLRTRQAAHASSLSAMVQSLGYSFAACGPWLFGLLHTRTGDWQLSLILLLALLSVQLFIGYLIGRGGFIEPRLLTGGEALGAEEQEGKRTE